MKVPILQAFSHIYYALDLPMTRDKSWDSEDDGLLLLKHAHSHHIGSLQQASPITSYMEQPCLTLFDLFEHTLYIHGQPTAPGVELSGSLASTLDVQCWMPSITKLNKQTSKKIAIYISSLTLNITLFLFITNFKSHCFVHVQPHSAAVSHACVHPFN